MAYFSATFEETCIHLRNLALALAVDSAGAEPIDFVGKPGDWSAQFEFEGWNITALLGGLTDKHRSVLEFLIEENRQSMVPHAIAAKRLHGDVCELRSCVDAFVDIRRRACVADKTRELRNGGAAKTEASRRALRYAARVDFKQARRHAPEYANMVATEAKMSAEVRKGWPAFGGLSKDAYLDRAMTRLSPASSVVEEGPALDFGG